MITVYVSIGNSDDKLTQREWSAYCNGVAELVAEYASRTHGVWFSDPSSPFQNMCWCIEVSQGAAPDLKNWLAKCAQDARQDSIAWAIAPATEFLS